MKKIKTLLTIPALVAIVPSTFVLTQCNKGDSGDRTPTIDPSVSEKVNATITKNEDGSVSCSLTPKSSTQKITSVSIKIGTNKLVEGTDYETNVNTSTNSTFNIKIYKSAFDKYQGNVVIIPTIADKTFNDLDVELTKTTFIIDEETFTSSHLKIYKSYEGTRGESIPWTDDKLSIWYKGSDITDEFIESGFECSELGTHSFTIKYDNKLPKTISITVSKKTYTITCSVENECVTINKTSIVAEEGTKWGTVKPTITGRTDVEPTNFDCTWEDDEGNEIADDDPIEEAFNANLILTFKNSSSPTSIACQSEGDSSKYNCDCYIPAQCAASPATWYDSDHTLMYEFTIDLSSCTGNFQYFWIAIKDSSKTAGGRLLTLGLDNIISVSYKASTTWAEIPKSNLSFHTMNGGTYMKYASSPYTSGSLKVQYRSLVKDTTQEVETNIIPAFEADNK